MLTIQFVYIYCSQLGLHGNWIKYYSQIQGVFNDSLTLGKQIKQDLERVYQSQTKENNIYQPPLRPPARPNQVKNNFSAKRGIILFFRLFPRQLMIQH
jgi:hypothetical protein